VTNAAVSDEARTVPKVWVLDDDGALRRALERLLRAAGFVVQTFGSPEELLAHAHAPLPDCLLLDIRLGSRSGFDLHEQLRALGLSIPTIFITGQDDAATREQARRARGSGYVPKPFNDTELLSAIEAALPR
jgi:FixJ family two-component response regulator